MQTKDCRVGGLVSDHIFIAKAAWRLDGILQRKPILNHEVSGTEKFPGTSEMLQISVVELILAVKSPCGMAASSLYFLMLPEF